MPKSGEGTGGRGDGAPTGAGCRVGWRSVAPASVAQRKHGPGQSLNAAASTIFCVQRTLSMSDGVLRSAERPGVIDQAVYGTIAVTSVLVVYDGWAHLKVWGAVAVVLGPIVAMVIGHVFSSSLAAYAALKRPPTAREVLRIARRRSRFLLVCVPQIVLLLVLTLAGLSLNDTVRVVIWISAASLGFWGGLAARRAGLGRRGIALGVITGLAVGGAVLLLRIFLQPGDATTNGVAAIQLI
jgi:hypothetical protein